VSKPVYSEMKSLLKSPDFKATHEVEYSLILSALKQSKKARAKQNQEDTTLESSAGNLSFFSSQTTSKTNPHATQTDSDGANFSPF